MEDQFAITVKNVSKNFLLPHERTTTLKSTFTQIFKVGKNRNIETQHALKNISFNVKQGEFFGIVGRNGSGKSTLLKMLAGIYQPTSGELTVKGRLVPFIELGVGFNPELTGRENVYLNGALLGFSEKEVGEFYDEVVKFAELERFMDQKLKNYSSGMQVRLAFSMAVQADADILLIDEVLAVGDADFQRKCFEYFKKLKKDKKTVVFVSHDMSAIKEYCDRCIFVNDSRLEKSGAPTEIAEEYLKLFNEHDNNKDSEDDQIKDEDRWGNKAVETVELKVKATKENILIYQKIKANKSAVVPIVGIRVRSSSGDEITGTNTKLEQVHIPSLDEGQILSIEWELKNVFSDGKYFIDPAIVGLDEITVYDWWNNARFFVNKTDRRIPYSIDLRPSIKIG